MTDCFALLEQPRLPHLDLTKLEQEFRQRARSLHPDAGAMESKVFAELNQAFTILRNPRLRLKHLLELENNAKLPDPLPAEWVDLFSRAAEIAQRARAKIATALISDTAIIRSIKELERKEICRDLDRVLRELEGKQTQAENDLERLNQEWVRNRNKAMKQAVRLQQGFSFIERWLSALRELRFDLNN